MKYKCQYCNKTVERDSEEKYIKSYCVESGKTVYIKRVDSLGRSNEKTDKIMEEDMPVSEKIRLKKKIHKYDDLISRVELEINRKKRGLKESKYQKERLEETKKDTERVLSILYPDQAPE